MKSRYAYFLCLLLALMTAAGLFVACPVLQRTYVLPEASWRVSYLTIHSDACPEGRHLERVNSGFENSHGGRWTTSSLVLVFPSQSLAHELLTASEQRLRQQWVGTQAPLQVLQCSWLI